ncbi:MAG: RNA ligase family protein [Candidatus Omnitrophota bacterium]
MRLPHHDMPKLEAPFERQEIDGRHVCIPKIKEGYRWVFTESEAVEKLDGTNVSVEITGKHISTIRNRLNLINIWQSGKIHFAEGILKAIEKGHFSEDREDGIYFGELIGEKLQGNPYKIQGHLWLPLDVIKVKYTYKFWQKDILPFLKDKTEEQIFEEVSSAFKGLWSLLKRRTIPTNESIKMDESLGFEGYAAEGIVFYSPNGEMAKLRRDMFAWFRGVAKQ